MAWSTGPEYQRLRVAVGDCSPELSQSLKDALQSRGVVDVTLCDTTEHLYRTLDSRVIDLVVYDYHLLGSRFVEAMQKIRRNEVGQNPFVTIVATIRESSLETVRRLIDGGVDDLIRSSASADRIFASIDKSIRRRKPFAITYDYVGPTRPVARRDPAPDVAQARVPNTLKSRLLERVSDESIDQIVVKAAEKLTRLQIQSCGAEIDLLAHRIADTCNGEAGTTENRVMHGALLKIGIVADVLRHRANNTPVDRVSDLAATLMPIAQRVLEAPIGRAAVEVQLLTQVATAVRRALSAEEAAQPVIREIADTVGTFTRRASSEAAQPFVV
jgi:DNA-binding response OmpR family regulator